MYQVYNFPSRDHSMVNISTSQSSQVSPVSSKMAKSWPLMAFLLVFGLLFTDLSGPASVEAVLPADIPYLTDWAQVIGSAFSPKVVRSRAMRMGEGYDDPNDPPTRPPCRICGLLQRDTPRFGKRQFSGYQPAQISAQDIELGNQLQNLVSEGGATRRRRSTIPT